MPIFLTANALLLSLPVTVPVTDDIAAATNSNQPITDQDFSPYLVRAPLLLEIYHFTV